MYLSRVEINKQRMDTKRALMNPQIMHAAIESCFPTRQNDTSERNLWRVEALNHGLYILLLSEQKPDFTHIIEQFGWPASGQAWDTKDYDTWLSGIQLGQHWHFKLEANPVHSVKESTNTNAKRGKIVSHTTVEFQKKWLADRAVSNGFCVTESLTERETPVGIYTFDVVRRDLKRFKRQGKIVTISTVTFEGNLIVENVELFIGALKNGIGRAKAYGCGLLTIARVP